VKEKKAFEILISFFCSWFIYLLLFIYFFLFCFMDCFDSLEWVNDGAWFIFAGLSLAKCRHLRVLCWKAKYLAKMFELFGRTNRRLDVLVVRAYCGHQVWFVFSIGNTFSQFVFSMENAFHFLDLYFEWKIHFILLLSKGRKATRSVLFSGFVLCEVKFNWWYLFFVFFYLCSTLCSQ